MLKLFIFLSIVLASIPMALAQTQSASLSGNTITSSYTSYSVNFGSSYSSIGQVCWDSTFSGNLLDPGESIQHSIVPMPINYWYGFINLGSTPLSTLTSCITPSHTGFNEFLDGSVTGSVWMTNGTVYLQSLSIRLVNAVSTATTTTTTTTSTTVPTTTTSTSTTATTINATSTTSSTTTTTVTTTTTTLATTLSQCSLGSSIPSSGCSCEYKNYYSGYCCGFGGGYYYASSCPPNCPQGAIPSSGCYCSRYSGGPLIEYSGYCCWGSYSPTACATTIQPCTDSDGGINTNVKGTGSGNYAGSTTRAYTTYDDNCPTSTQINEAFCDSSTGLLSVIGLSCPNGCSNGVCLSATNATTATTIAGALPQCTIGLPVASSGCKCGTSNIYSGYCCRPQTGSDYYYHTNCPESFLPQCSEGPIPSSGCRCQDINLYSGNCCFSKLLNALVWSGNTPCTQTCPSMGGVCCYGAASDCIGTWNGKWAVDCQGYVCCVGTCKNKPPWETTTTVTTAPSSLPQCTLNSPIPSSGCSCASNYYTGYCCGSFIPGYWSSSPCTTTNATTTTIPTAQPITCPLIAYPSSSLCPDGTFVPRYDDRNCIVGYDCQRALCGNGRCESGEYPSNCFIDCGHYCPQYIISCPASGYIIKGDVDSSGCPRPSACCGDNACSNIENTKNCPTDCGIEKPFCGNARCDIGEDSFSCPSDCRGECPVTVHCPDGSENPCRKVDFGCVCEPCPIDPSRLPSGCRQETNKVTASINVICETRLSCPELPREKLEFMKGECVRQGGEFLFVKNPAGCEYPDCRFVEESNNPFQTFGKCHTQDDIEAIKIKCANLGLPVQIDVKDECKVTTCGRPTEDLCGKPASSEKEEIRNKCREQGLRTIRSFSENGCPVLECREAFECPKELPEEAYKKCQGIGGEMIVKKDENGCVRFADCLRPGDDRDARVDPIERVPDSAELLEIAFKLEGLRIKLDTLADQANSVATYYESTGSQDAERWKRVADMFESAVQEVDKIKNELRSKLEDVTLDDLLEVRRAVRYLSDVLLRDIAYVMLSTSDDVTKIDEQKDCGTDSSCFERAFRRCQPIIFYPEGREGPKVELVGLEGDTCVLKASMQEPVVDMTCKIPNYARGVRNPETDIFPHCEGPMVEMIKQSVAEPKEVPALPETVPAGVIGATRTPSGELVITACQAGLYNCNNIAEDGCESRFPCQ